jgi:hypothetical protein
MMTSGRPAIASAIAMSPCVGDLDVRRLPLDQAHVVAGSLGQVASSVASIASCAPYSSAAASTSRRNACGVWARWMVSRGNVSAT